jgi:hypothetical protein
MVFGSTFSQKVEEIKLILKVFIFRNENKE